jgi:hypothetical protein
MIVALEIRGGSSWFLNWKTWGKAHLGVELSLEMEGKPITPLGIAAVFEDLSRRFPMFNSMQHEVTDTLALTAETINRIGTPMNWRRLLKVIAPAGVLARTPETIQRSAAAVGFLSPTLLRSRGGDSGASGLGGGSIDVAHEPDGSLKLYPETVAEHEHARLPREEHLARMAYEKMFEAGAVKIAHELGRCSTARCHY